MDRSFYVYFHRRKDTNQVFYVGKGRGDRATSVEGRNRRWLKVACEVGRTIEYVKVDLTEQEAFRLERDVIALLRARGLNLANISDGHIQGQGRRTKTKRDLSTLRNYPLPLLRRKTNRSLYGSMRYRAVPHDGEDFYRWKRTDSDKDLMRTALQMSEQFGISEQELSNVLDGHILATKCGWCVFKPRGPRK